MKEEGMMDDEVDNVCDVRAATTFMFDGGSPTGGGERRPKQPRRSCPSTTLRPGPRRGRKGRPADDYPRDGVRKTSHRDDSRNLERDWVHDRFEDDDSRHPSRSRGHRSERLSRRSPDAERESGYKIRVENLHYELTEDDIYELFERIGPVENARLMYDRHDRSEGVAFVTYRSLADARVACREYDGANAHGQPIRLTLVPPGPAPRRNPSDTAQRPSRSLFERIETRDRSLSPDRVRRSDVTKPPPAGIDRYVPGEDSGRRRSPPPPRRRGGGRESGRRPGERRTGGRGGRRADDDGRPVVQGRPRKTQDELDAEMEDYWGVGHDGAADAPVNGSGDVQSGPADPGAAANNAINDDIEMEVE
ncbi:RNA recognition motif-containing protein [Phyllosticta citricarpa]